MGFLSSHDFGSEPDVWITLNDGVNNTIWNPSIRGSRAFDSVRLSQHAMRFHIYDRYTNRATEHYVNTNKEFYQRVKSVISSRTGLIYNASMWIDVFMKPMEFWPSMRWQNIALKELTEIGGWKNVEITGCSIRYIKYVSDGSFSRTPDAIGKHKGRPLVYKGRTVAVIFKLNGQDVLRDDSNVVYTLPKKWWHGFHARYRKIPKDFPGYGRLGVVCTNWCQRHGHAGYSGGIWIASMTQGQSLGSWTSTQLRNYWKKRGGIRDDEARTLKASGKKQYVSEEIKKKMAATAIAAATLKTTHPHIKLGLVGSKCVKCGSFLLEPFGKCLCGFTTNISAIWKGWYAFTTTCGFCLTCGLPICESNYWVEHIRCKCEGEDKAMLMASTSNEFTMPKQILTSTYLEVIKSWS